MLLCLLRITPERERIMPIAHLAKAAVPLPTVSANGRAYRYIFLDECRKRIGIATRKIRLSDTGDNAEPESSSISEFLDRNAAFMDILPFRTAILGILARPNLNSANHCRLMMNSPSFPTRSAANATFVNFDGMRGANGIAIRAHHPRPEFVKDCERRLVTGDAELALELDGRLAGRLRRHEVCAPKPSREWHMSRLHDRTRRERRIVFAGAATQYNRRAGSKPVWFADDTALLAREAVWPADRLQITGASAIIRKDALKLRKARWEGRIHGLENTIGRCVCQASG